MFRAVLFLVPLQLYSQSICVPFSDSTQTIVHSDSRPLFMSKDEFEMKLVSSARSKLARTINGVTVNQNLYVYQEGGQRVTTLTQIGTNQGSMAVFAHECYHITYKGRKGTIVLRADPASTQPTMRISAIPLPVRQPPPREYLGLTKQQWWNMAPYYVVYAMIILM